MSESQRSNSPTEPSPNDGDELHSRPALPPRPSTSASELLLSSSATLLASPTATNSFPLLSRKPVVPRRSSRISLDKRSYTPIQMSDIPSNSENSPKQIHRKEGSITSNQTTQKAHLESGYLPPKSFHKTHQFFWWDLGYWRMPARHGSIFAILFLSTFLPGWYSQYGFTKVIRESSIAPFAFDCMDSSGWSFVGIDLVPFRRFSFGEAKAIDLAWNWVVGRGLQGILTLLAYRVFSDALLRVAELTAVPFELYATLALPSTKIELLWQVCKNLFKRGNWRVKMIFMWLIISTIYLISVPGLMDAATAYESSYYTNFLWPSSGQSVRVDELSDWEISSSIVKQTQVCTRFYSRTSVQKGWPLYIHKPEDVSNITYTHFLGNESTEAEHLNFGVCNNVTTKFKGYIVYSPSGFLYDWTDKQINNTWWAKFEESPFDAMETGAWSSWEFEPTARKSFQCIVETDSYLWGFSFEWLFLITMINSVWLWGLWILWVDCDTNSEFCRKRRRLGVWRAIADLSEAMREELGRDICAYSDDDLRKALQKRGSVKYYARRGTEGEPGHLGLSTRKSGKFVIQWEREYGKEKLL